MERVCCEEVFVGALAFCHAEGQGWVELISLEEEVPTGTEQFIYAMDCFTVDPMLGKRISVFAVISRKTREIIQLAITELRPENVSGSS